MNNSINKPLTNRMIEILMDCHERELMRLEPCNAGTTRHVRALIERRLLSAKEYKTEKGKKIISLYVTGLGKIYLSNL